LIIDAKMDALNEETENEDLRVYLVSKVES